MDWTVWSRDWDCRTWREDVERRSGFQYENHTVVPLHAVFVRSPFGFDSEGQNVVEMYHELTMANSKRVHTLA